MSELLVQFLEWVAVSPHFLWRVPVVIVAALFGWAVWMWLWDVSWPWARLVLKILGRFFSRIADALEWLPCKSKATVAYLEHILRVCDGTHAGCPHHGEIAT